MWSVEKESVNYLNIVKYFTCLTSSSNHKYREKRMEIDTCTFLQTSAKVGTFAVHHSPFTVLLPLYVPCLLSPVCVICNMDLWELWGREKAKEKAKLICWCQAGREGMLSMFEIKVKTCVFVLSSALSLFVVPLCTLYMTLCMCCLLLLLLFF